MQLQYVNLDQIMSLIFIHYKWQLSKTLICVNQELSQKILQPQLQLSIIFSKAQGNHLNLMSFLL